MAAPLRKHWHFSDPRLDRTLQEIIDHTNGVKRFDKDESQDLSAYAYLFGRPKGQKLIGGTGAGENLTLESTSHATKGHVGVMGELRVISPATGKAFAMKYNDALDTLDISFEEP